MNALFRPSRRIGFTLIEAARGDGDHRHSDRPPGAGRAARARVRAGPSVPNNLKQMALAAHLHADNYKVLPASPR